MRHTAVMTAVLLAVAIGCNPADSGGSSEPVKSDSYYLPRHASLSSVPIGLSEGTIQLRGQCLYLGSNLLIWPEHYRIGNVMGRDVVVGDAWTIEPGDAIAIGGGEYAEADQLPSPIIGEPPPCSGPYGWVSEVIRVSPR